MAQRPRQTWNKWPGWSIISASDLSSFTLWFTGLHGTGKSTIADLVKSALTMRGYKVEIIDSNSLSYWLQSELHITETVQGDQSHTPGYDAFVTYLCAILARNGVITIASSVSPYRGARAYAREHISHFIEIYLHCSPWKRPERVRKKELLPSVDDHLYEEPEQVELSLDTSNNSLEWSALRILLYLEQHGYIVPLLEAPPSDKELALIKERLLPSYYLN
jgi:adenylylsulfate kinase